MTQPEPIMIRVESRQLTHEESRQMLQRPAGEDAAERSARAAAELQRQLSRPIADQLRSHSQAFLRRPARDLLRELDRVAGPDDPETRELLRDVFAAIDLRRDEWPE
jgi:hypothetical protein